MISNETTKKVLKIALIGIVVVGVCYVGYTKGFNVLKLFRK